jgi:hypothetical protein
MWGYEVYEMMKRLFLVAILPLLGEGVMRAFIGILVSTGAAFWARESWPFVKSTNSKLALAANVQILGVFFASAVLITDSLGSFGLDDLTMGVLLLLLNLVCLVLVAYWCIKIEAAEMERRAWRQNLELSWTEQQLVRDIMEGRNLPDGSGGGDNGGGDGAWFDDATGTDDDKDKKKTPQLEMTRLKEGGGVEDEASEARRRAEREQEVLEQVLLPPKNVQLMEKIGAGAFGE